MKLELELPDELIKRIVASIMENFPEASSGNALRCADYRYFHTDLEQTKLTPGGPRFVFEDDEEGKKYIVGETELLAAFPLIFTDKWPKGCTKPPFSNEWEQWDNWLCQCDATDFDAFVQLVCIGEVIYG